MSQPLELHRFSGTHTEIGEQYGRACRERILRHLELALAKLEDAGIARDDATAVALAYRPFVVEHAPFLDEEIAGVAAGAGIPLAEAYLLQLRAEVFADLLGAPAAESECTTFAIEPSAARGGIALAGQNADLPEIYEELMVVVEFAPTVGRRVLMVVPAGQVSYVGISDSGMAVFANFLQCRGWVRGFPRYLLSRYALEFPSVEGAIDALRALPRASSRNLLLLGADGRAIDFENTPARDALLEPRDGVLVHSNHYLADELLDEEISRGGSLKNSRVRLDRIRELIASVDGPLGRVELAGIMRDRRDAPDALSVEPRDLPNDIAPPEGHYMTVAAVIAEPGEGRMWVTAGPPSRTEYVPYSFSDHPQDLPTL